MTAATRTLLALEARRRWRSRRARGGVVVVAIAAAAFRLGAGPGLEAVGHAYALALVLACAFGVGEDRARGLDRLLVPAFVGPGAYLAVRAAGLAGWLAALAAVAAAAGLAFGAAPAWALWAPAAFTLVALLFAPAVLLLELASASRTPAVFVLLAFAGAVVAGEIVQGDPGLAVRALGLDPVAPDWRTLRPLAARALVAGPLGLLVLAPLARRRIAGPGRRE